MTESELAFDRIGRYVVKRELGRGGMGVVYLAQDPDLPREVAIKLLLPKGMQNDQARERFVREARALALIKSPHVIHVYQVGEVEGVPFYVMELLQGYPLDALIRSGKKLELEQIIDLGIDFSKGISDAHAVKIIHRDIKPANLYVEQPRSNGKVIDFGLTRLPETTELTQSNAFMGTPLYMPLEQAKGESVDHRADIYSLGVVLYQLITGNVPIAIRNIYELIPVLESTEPPRVETLNPDTPRRLADLIHRMLAKMPAARPQTMQDVVDELVIIRGARSSAKFPMVLDHLPVAELVTENPGGSPTKLAGSGSSQPTMSLEPKQGGKGFLWLFLALVFILVGWAVKHFTLDYPSVGESEGAMEFVRRHPNEPELLDCTGPEGSSPEKSQEAQKKWAEYLGIPVETSVEVGGGLKMEFVLIPPGKFMMGGTPAEHEAYLKSLAANEKQSESLGWDLPRHQVIISRPFYFGKYEVLQTEYTRLTNRANPSRFKVDTSGKTTPEPMPVETVSWDDASFAAERLTAQALPRGFTKATLPTEAQWEYACRAGTTTVFHFGSGLDAVLANCDGKYPFGSPVTRPFLGKTIPVRGASKSDRGMEPNAFGLYQMHGNVLEWCADGFDEMAYARHKPVDPKIGEAGRYRVLRGGSWNNSAWGCRSAERFRNDRKEAKPMYGFRLMLVMD